ncbi:MAG: hypothetical protein GY697_25700, partial [Desulfobacterales bacterium]|nr:hypothetical protein [Desulfobacterales bacterium]
MISFLIVAIRLTTKGPEKVFDKVFDRIMAAPRRPQKVVYIGHSFVKGMLDSERSRSIRQNGGFDRNQHLCKYVTCLPPDVQIYLARDLVDNFDALRREIGFADIVVIVMGTNDLVSAPLDLDKHVNDLLKVGVMLVASGTARYIAYVEVVARLMPNGFGKKAADQFKVKRGVRSPRDIDNYFWSLAMIFNSKLSTRVTNHPDCFIINLE